jgi:hypothetical protein
LGATAGGAFQIALGADAAQGAVTLTLASVPSALQIEAALRAGVITLLDDQGQTETVPLTGVAGATLSLGSGLSAAYTTANQTLVTGGVARFKWSRENAAFAVGVVSVDTADLKTLTLSSLGRDQVTLLRTGDLVEISDDASELGPGRGHLTYLVADPDPDLLTVILADPLPAAFFVTGSADSPPPLQPGRHPTLRRWDNVGWANAAFDPLTTPDMNLGDGVHIQFGGEQLQPGDFWLFTTRSVDGSVEALVDAPPMGIVRQRCPLAVVRWAWVADNTGNRLTFAVVNDCRSFFPALDHLTGLFYVSGDGQEVMPDFSQPGQFLPLQERLCVGVANGGCQVANAQVEFQVSKGAGRLENGQQRFVVASGADGLARCGWELRWDQDPPAANPTPLTQQVTARLLNDEGNAIHLPVIFTANLSRADQVAYNPANCANLAAAGVKTVQEAIDALCRVEPGGCEITVGKGGQYGRLEEAIEALRKENAVTWCICLLPGEHRLPEGLQLEGEIHVSISACSHGVLLILEQPIEAKGIISFKLAGMTIINLARMALVLDSCREITIADVTMRDGEHDRGDGVIHCAQCGSLTMHGDIIQANNRQMLLHCDGTETVEIHGCQLTGQENVPFGTIIGNARRIVLAENQLIAPSIKGDTPRRVLQSVPELIELFEVTDREPFMRRAFTLVQEIMARGEGDRAAIAKSISEQVRRLGNNLPRREGQLYVELANVIQLDRSEEMLTLLIVLRDLSVALVLRDGEADTTLHANVITGLVSLYGEPGSDEIRDNTDAFSLLKKAIQQRGLEPITAQGHFQGSGNRFTRLVLGEEMVKWVLTVQEGQTPERPGMRIYRTCLLTDTIIDIGRNYFMAERISLTATQFCSPIFERSGISIGLAASFVSNDHYRSTSPFAFVNVCPIRVETPNLNLMEIDHI